MGLPNINILDALNHLLSRNIEMMNAYLRVSRIVNYHNLDNWLLSQTQQREDIVRDLQIQLNNIGGTESKKISYCNTLHPRWIKLDPSWSVDQIAVQLNALKTGEEKAYRDYTEVLYTQPDVTADLTKILKKHRTQVEMSIDELDLLNDIYQGLEEAA